MNVLFTEHGWRDYRHWVEHDPRMQGRVNALIEDARRHLLIGLGKPEPLKGELAGWWSRRISGDHRLVYRIVGKAPVDQRLEVVACRYHYGD